MLTTEHGEVLSYTLRDGNMQTIRTVIGVRMDARNWSRVKNTTLTRGTFALGRIRMALV